MRKLYPILAFAALFALCTNFAKAQFFTELAIPPLLDSTVYDLTMDREVHNFNQNDTIGPTSLNRDINTFAFNNAGTSGNSYLGPTMVWTKGDSITLRITNLLNIPNNSSPGSYPPPTTVHLHGAHVPAWVDGGPHGVIPPSGTRTVKFKVMDDACTLWYHPHGEDETYTQVEMGLAGMIIVDDPNDPIRTQLPHTYRIDDIPLVIQDHVFDTVHTHIGPNDSTWGYTGVLDTTRLQKQRTVIVNGISNPYYDVPPQPVRFRILNGSSRLAYQLGFGTINGQVVTPLPFKIIASDGGYLSDSARTVTSFMTGPGIRNEVVFDFTGRANETIYLLNLNDQLRPLIINANGEGCTDLGFVQFRVGATQIQPVGIVPALPALIPYNANTPDTTRLKRLLGLGGANNTPRFSIDNNQYIYDQVNDIVREGDIEVWTIDNQTNVAHPFHIHDIQFYVLDVTNDLGQAVTPIPVEFLGRKDDIMVEAGWQVRFVTKFDDFGRPGPFTGLLLDSAAYMYHCHILTHEDGYYAGNTVPQRLDHGMMQQFVVWNGQTITETDGQNLTDDMVLFPNPATYMLNLSGESRSASSLRIMDLQGRELIRQELAAFDGTISIPVNGLSAGLVLVEWSSPKGTFTKKVVLQ